MSSIVLNCPECDKQVKVPADAVGKKVRCKSCQHVFVAQQPGGKAAPAKPAPVKAAKAAGKPGGPGKAAKKAVGHEEEAEGAYGVTDTELGVRCPQCADEMEEGQVVCLACGYNTQTRVQTRMRKVKDITGGDKFKWLLPGILCVLGIFLVVGYCFFHHFALPNILIDNWDKLVEDKGGRNAAAGDEASGGQGYLFYGAFELWMCIMAAFLCWGLGRFAVKRLIYNNQPPEVEIR
jgi:hypothetical protein